MFVKKTKPAALNQKLKKMDWERKRNFTARRVDWTSKRKPEEWRTNVLQLCHRRRAMVEALIRLLQAIKRWKAARARTGQNLHTSMGRCENNREQQSMCIFPMCFEHTIISGHKRCCGQVWTGLESWMEGTKIVKFATSQFFTNWKLSAQLDISRILTLHSILEPINVCIVYAFSWQYFSKMIAELSKTVKISAKFGSKSCLKEYRVLSCLFQWKFQQYQLVHIFKYIWVHLCLSNKRHAHDILHFVNFENPKKDLFDCCAAAIHSRLTKTA